MIVKKHRNNNRLILAICDEDLIGKKFEEGKKQLDLTTDFYNGEEMPEEKIKELIKKSYFINLVGKKAVNLGLKLKIIEKKNIIYINRIPHTQVIFF